MTYQEIRDYCYSFLKISFCLDAGDSEIRINKFKRSWIYVFLIFSGFISIARFLVEVMATALSKQNLKSIIGNLRSACLTITFYFMGFKELSYRDAPSQSLEAFNRFWTKGQFIRSVYQCFLATNPDVDKRHFDDPLASISAKYWDVLKCDSSNINFKNDGKLEFIQCAMLSDALSKNQNLKKVIIESGHDKLVLKRKKTNYQKNKLVNIFDSVTKILVCVDISERSERVIAFRLMKLLEIRHPELKKFYRFENGGDLDESLFSDFTKISKKDSGRAQFDMIFSRGCASLFTRNYQGYQVYFFDFASHARNSLELFSVPHYKVSVDSLKQQRLSSLDFF